MTIPASYRFPFRSLSAAIALPTEHTATDAPPCPGCEQPIAGRYCGECGEPRPARDLSLLALAEAGLEHLFSLDVRLLRTVRALVARPGYLTIEWRRGVRARFTRPMQLFLLVTGVFFVGMPFLGGSYNTRAILGFAPVAAKSVGAQPDKTISVSIRTTELRRRADAVMRRTGEGTDAFVERFDRKTDNVERGLIVLFVPALALLLAVLHAGRRRYVVEHVVFATHLFTFVLVYALLLIATARVAGMAVGVVERGYRALVHHPTPAAAPPSTAVVASLLLVALAMALGYLYLALRRAYAGSWWASALRTGVIALALCAGLSVYQRMLYDVAMRLM